MVSVKVVEAVIDEVVVSVPTTVKVYMPFAAVVVLGDADEEDAPPLEQPVSAKPIIASRKNPTSAPSFRERKPSRPTSNNPAKPKPACRVITRTLLLFGGWALLR
jgi:hypothetical protein